MQFVEEDCKILNRNNQLKLIEFAARKCYDSVDKTTDDSYISMIKMLLNKEHVAMIEHGVISLSLPTYVVSSLKKQLNIQDLKYFNSTDDTRPNKTDPNNRTILSGNFRSFRDLFNLYGKYPRLNGILDSIASIVNKEYPIIYQKQITDLGMYLHKDLDIEIVNPIDIPTLPISERKYHDHMSVLFVIDRGISHELVRHRPCSFAQVSTRYVSYKDRGLPILKPVWLGEEDCIGTKDFVTAVTVAEESYNLLLNVYKWRPEQARNILPNALMTELIVTANLVEWDHIFNLRYRGTTGRVHPQMKSIMSKLYEDAKLQFPEMWS